MLFSTKNLIRFLYLLVVVLAFAAGYFQSALEVKQRKIQVLEQQIFKLEKKLEESKA